MNNKKMTRSLQIILIMAFVFLCNFLEQEANILLSSQYSIGSIVEKAESTIQTTNNVIQQEVVSDELVRLGIGNGVSVAIYKAEQSSLRTFDTHTAYLTIIILAALLIFILHILVVWLFGRRKIQLWQMISYIHLLDGKKRVLNRN